MAPCHAGRSPKPSSTPEPSRQAVGMISQGERPGYCVRIVADPAGVARGLVGLPGVTGTAASRRDAPDAARAAIAAVLEVPADAFDVET
jgi:hypothetical protein